MLKRSREEVFKYMTGIIQKKQCHVFQINGVDDHLHILMKLHPSVSLADLIKTIKISSSALIKDKLLFPEFTGWQIGYSAFTYSNNALPNLIRYVQNQEAHHGCVTYEDEYINLLEEHGIEYDPKFVLD